MDCVSGKMTSPCHQMSSPGSSNEDQEKHSTPPPLLMPAEIIIFQEQDKSFNNNSVNEQNYQTDFHQTPTQNGKKSFCIDALLAKNQNENGSENHRNYNQFVNNNYNDNLISRDLNNSPDDQMSRLN